MKTVISILFACHILLIAKYGRTEDCTQQEVTINSCEVLTTVLASIKWKTSYKSYRAEYGMNLNMGDQKYANRTVWVNTLKSNEIKTLSYTSIDSEMTEQERTIFPNMISVPVMAGAIAFVYNLPNVTDLNLSLSVISDIFSKKITHWNDLSIHKLNPQLNLPPNKITVLVSNFDTTTDTQLMSTMLSNYSKDFRENYGVFDNWPKTDAFTVPKANWVAEVMNNAYSMTYATLPILEVLYMGSKVRIPMAKIFNNFGILTEINTNSIVDAVQRAFVKNLDDINTGRLLHADSYPFVFIKYVIFNQHTPNPTMCCSMQEAVGYAQYMMESNVNQLTLFSDGFFSLPQNVIDYVKSNVLPLITCNNTVLIDEYRKYKSQRQSGQKIELALAIGLSLCSVLALVFLAFLWYHKHVKLARETLWLINPVEINSINENLAKSVKSRLSLNSTAVLSLTLSRQFNMERAAWTTRQLKTFVKPIQFLKQTKHVSKWKRKTKLMLSVFARDFTHTNISSFYGITIKKTIPYIVHQHCMKGTLNFVLKTCPYQMTLDIKYNLASNVLSGLTYLHKKNVLLGNLSSITCYVDSMWNAKIVDWIDYNIALSEGSVFKENLKTKDIPDENTLIQLLYLDPEIEELEKSTVECDIFSYGMMLVEIFTRKLPFEEEIDLGRTSYGEIFENKFRAKLQMTPEMHANEVPEDVAFLVKKMVGPTSGRPSTDTITKIMEKLWDIGNNKTIVDIMMEAMDDYVADLEDKVVERTSELTVITKRMKDLLNELLPPQIATKFINGERTEPEFFECATICFSDVVGFTMISARSTPDQVMSFLNELWKLFDKTVEKFDVYKVDTIGDAYMVASGLPSRNGIDHCKHIADLALRLIDEAQTFVIPHLHGEMLKIRMGINSGPVTAGIVGFKMPQYCIFGDTVNTASRMESTSLPLKIQASEFTHQLIEDYFPSKYRFELRGETEVKV